MKTQRVALFDFDDTLFQVGKADFLAGQAAFSKHLTKVGVQDFNFGNYRGKDVVQVCDVLNQQHNLSLKPEVVRKDFREAFFANLDKVAPATGLYNTLSNLQDQNVILGISSSAPMPRIARVLEHFTAKDSFNFAEAFSHQGKSTIFSAQDSLPTPQMKPLPAVWLFARQKIGVFGANTSITCLDDSGTGVESALRFREAVKQVDPAQRVQVVHYNNAGHATNGAAKALMSIKDVGVVDHAIDSMTQLSKLILPADVRGLDHRSETHSAPNRPLMLPAHMASAFVPKKDR